MKKNLISSFVGGFTGIILAGYTNYLFGQGYDWLLPIGVLVGCSLGYFLENFINFIGTFPAKIENFQEIMRDVRRIFRPVLKSISKDLLKSLYKFLNFFKKVFLFFVKMFSKIYKFLSHPVNKSIMLRMLCSTIIFGIFGYIWVFYFIGNPLMELHNSKNGDTNLGVFAIYPLFSGLCVILSPILWAIFKIMKIYDDRVSLLHEYKLYEDRIKLIKENFISDLKLFLLFQIIALFIITCLLIGFSYIFVVGIPFMFIGWISMIVLGYLQAMKNHRVLSVFLTTLLITTISYFIFRNMLDSQVMIWVIAFSTGGVCSFASYSLQKIISRIADVGEDSTYFADFLFTKVFTIIPKYIYKKITPLEVKFEIVRERFLTF